MNHIDEGTIHAWLDGALSAERAREVEAHVAQCAECSSAVAEARGLIAGASRILTALDDVPANVMPKRAPVAPPAAPPRRQRQWRAAPWVTGIAAALILAVGITTWSRNSGRMMRSDVATAMVETDSVKATSAVVEMQRGGAGPTANIAPPASKTPPPVVEAPASERSVAPRRIMATSGDASPQKRSAEGAPAAPTAVVAGGRVAGVTVTIDTAAERRESRDFAAAGADTTRLRTTSSSRISVSRGLSAQSDTARLRATAQLTDSSTVRIRGERSLRLEEVVVTGVGSNVARDSANVRQIAGCYQLAKPAEERGGVAKLPERIAAAAPPSEASRRAVPSLARADVGEMRAPARVRLDTTQSRVGFVVRDERSDAYLGTWQRVGQSDSVRVILPAHGTFLVTAKDRVNCPDR